MNDPEPDDAGSQEVWRLVDQFLETYVEPAAINLEDVLDAFAEWLIETGRLPPAALPASAE